MVVCWADPIWWSGVGAWCMVWSVVESETHLIVLCGALISGGSHGQLMWSGSMA